MLSVQNNLEDYTEVHGNCVKGYCEYNASLKVLNKCRH